MRRYGFAFAAIVFVLVPLAFPSIETNQGKGSIEGTVLDEKGRPVKGVKVNADPADSRIRASLVRYVETSEQGEFVIDRLDWGDYKVFTKKEEAGYPNMSYAFYSNDVYPKASLSPQTPVAKLQLKLSPKAGLLFGVVKDASTGQPVDPRIKLFRARDTRKWISVGAASNYSALLPPATEVAIEVSANGYKTRSYGSAGSGSKPLRLRAGQKKRLDVMLDRDLR